MIVDDINYKLSFQSGRVISFLWFCVAVVVMTVYLLIALPVGLVRYTMGVE